MFAEAWQSAPLINTLLSDYKISFFSVYVTGHQGAGPPELELQVVVRCPMWVLGNELRASGRKALVTEPCLQPQIERFFSWPIFFLYYKYLEISETMLNCVLYGSFNVIFVI